MAEVNLYPHRRCTGASDKLGKCEKEGIYVVTMLDGRMQKYACEEHSKESDVSCRQLFSEFYDDMIVTATERKLARMPYEPFDVGTMVQVERQEGEYDVGSVGGYDVANKKYWVVFHHGEEERYHRDRLVKYEP